MTYEAIDKGRFARLLELGTDDDELRRFFTESRSLLIQKGARVQNLPHGKAARVRMLVQGMPDATNRVVQKWFCEHLKMLDPISADKVLEELRLYEQDGAFLPEDEAKRLARSCLVHLFSNTPPVELLSFLRPVQAEAAVDQPGIQEIPNATAAAQTSDALSEAFGRAIVALVEGRDPDEYLSSLPAPTAAFVAGLHAARNDQVNEVQIALGNLDVHKEARAVLTEYVTRKKGNRSSGGGGLQMLNFARPDDAFSFDFERDEVLAVCTRDYPETTVFLHPSAIRAADGSWLDLSNDAYREKLFYSSGDLIAFSEGRDKPRQPKRGEIGIWRVAENEGSNTGHRTNFHIASDKTIVYEVRDVPFDSSKADEVREYIKHTYEGHNTAVTPVLFLLRDQLIVGCPLGKDLTKDAGFDAGLPCWQTLSAFRLEGRVFVPGPLPPFDLYECEALASSLRKLFTGEYWDSEKPIKAHARKLQELIASGRARLNFQRAARLRAELACIEEHEGAMSVLLQEVMRDPRINAQVDELVHTKVNELVEREGRLRKSVLKLEQRQAELLELQRNEEKDQKRIAPAITKAIRGAFDKARADVLGTLGETVVFKTLMDELIERPVPIAIGTTPHLPRLAGANDGASNVRSSISKGRSINETLRALGVTSKAAFAIETVGTMAKDCGLILIVDGLAARIAVEAWVSEGEKSGVVIDCGFGEINDRAIQTALGDSPVSLAILDANLSPFELYARPLIDAVFRRLAEINDQSFNTRVFMSVVDGAAALPISAVTESLSLKVSLDRIPEFIQENEAKDWLDEIEDTESNNEWLAKLWKPARTKVMNYLRKLPLEEVALILSVFNTRQIEKRF